MTTPVIFGRFIIAPIIADFLTQYPEIKVDLILSDKHMDLIAEGIDIAIRARQLEDSALVARHLFENPMFLVASPGYLAKSGTPEKPEELNHHKCIVYSQLKTVNI